MRGDPHVLVIDNERADIAAKIDRVYLVKEKPVKDWQKRQKQKAKRKKRR